MLRLFNSYMPELPKLNDILYSGNIAYGFYGNLFEEKLREKLQNPYILTTSNFFYAISIVLSTFGIKTGDEVLISPLNCLAAVMPYKNYGLEIKFVDINISTGTLSVEAVKKAITNKTKLIVLSHFCGYQGEIVEIRKIAKENNIFLINDCFEAFMSFDNEVKNANALSNEAFIYHFGPTKLPNTIDGGCVEFFQESFFVNANMIRDLGIDRKLFRKDNGEIDETYDVKFNSFGAMMTEVNSYIGTVQLEKFDTLKKKMRNNTICNKLAIEKILTFNHSFLRNQNKTNNWVFGFLSESKEEEMLALKKIGIGCSGVHTTLSHNSIYANTSEEFPNTDVFINKFIAIPNGWWIDTNNIDLVKIEHCALNDVMKDQIINFKDKIWKHGYDSQNKWITDNHSKDDLHFFMRANDLVIAYLSLVNVLIKDNQANAEIRCKGLCNVSVLPSLRGYGVGKQLIEDIENNYFSHGNFILLCSDENIEFYRKCGFHLFSGELFDYSAKKIDTNLMYKGFIISESRCYLEKIF